MKKIINGKEELVDFAGRPAPKMPDGMIAVLIDDEWVARKATSYERAELEELTLADVATMIEQLKIMYPNHFKGMDKDTLAKMSKMWFVKLKKYDRKLVNRAFVKCTDVMSQPPVPADILKTITKLKNGTLV